MTRHAEPCTDAADSVRRTDITRGALLVVGAMAGGTTLLLAAGRLGWLATRTSARPISSLIMLAAMATLAAGVRRLWRARAGRFDGIGLLALALTLSAALSLALFAAILFLIWAGGSWLE